jgi:hypothetical protein
MKYERLLGASSDSAELLLREFLPSSRRPLVKELVVGKALLMGSALCDPFLLQTSWYRRAAHDGSGAAPKAPEVAPTG